LNGISNAAREPNGPERQERALGFHSYDAAPDGQKVLSKRRLALGYL
jgi:ribosomal protein L34